ncbi:PD-(D/E)XK nuclease family protein, partial [Clostridium sp. UBA6640]|uniref:PD-(D/E)XK nuclease family protein n=1 Tax=Clostridium sp. UBA6640 TaxID=1946370 RepID=UPI0025B95F53
MNKQARISVRNLVEFIYRYGDLTNEYISHGRALEGTKIHQKVQKQLDKEYEDNDNAKFEKEVSIKETFKVKDFELTLEGRIDGIIISQEITNILEIKSTKRQLFDITNENLLHSAQAKLYGYMYAFTNALKDINITVMYVNTENYDIKEFTTKYSFNDLEEFFYETV